MPRSALRARRGPRRGPPASRWLATLALSLRLVAPGAAAAQAGQVTIYRDDYGVPHIYAEREADGYYGLGYAQGEDQLELQLRFFLQARGEEAAVFGKAHLATDYLARLWRHAEEARAGFARLSPELQANYRAYVAGLQRYMRDHPDRVPAWAPRLEPWDPVALSRWLLWLGYQAGEGLRNCQAGGVRLAAAEAAAVDRAQVAASNEWVLAPWRTAMNAMVVLSDPHGGVDGSFVYEFRMHAGQLEMAGFAMGALPLLTHNRHVSWGMTTGAPDVADCYEVAVDPARPTRYRFDERVLAMETRTVTMAARDTTPLRRRLEYTRHNGVLSPVVARAGDRAWVVSTTYMHDAGVFDEEVYRMNLARDVGEVRDAMRRLGMFPQNVMVGDRHGSSWYVRAGKAPRRPAGYDWNRPVPGNTSATAWLGIHPLEDLVQLENPPAGYMQNNNISPDRMLEQSPLRRDRYPDYLFHDRPGRTNSRGRRAVEILSAAFQFTEADAIELALDEYWVDTDDWRSALRRALDQEAEWASRQPAAVRRVAANLLAFDGHARAGSAPALQFWYWRDLLRAGLDGARVRTPDSVRPTGPLPAEQARALARAVARVADTLGRMPRGLERTLGDEFRLVRGPHSFPVGGVSAAPADLRQCESLTDLDRACTMTLRAFTAGAPDAAGRRAVYLGSRLLRLVVFTEPLRAWTLHNFGQSSDPASPHYADQARLSSERRLKPVYFERAELLPHVRSTRQLDVP